MTVSGYGWGSGACYGETDARIQSYALPVGPGTLDQYTIMFTVYMKYCGKIGIGAMPQEIVFNAYEWDVKRTADGIVIENGREAEHEYCSQFLRVDISPGL